MVHADRGAKPLNWMSPPCTIEEREDGWTVLGPRGERLEIAIDRVVHDERIDLGIEPGLRKTGGESELQALLAAHPDVLEPGAALVTREYPTDLGPVDLLLVDTSGDLIAVEVKRVGELDAVEQLSRYLERLNSLGSLGRVRGILAAGTIKPQTRVLAEARGIGWVEVDVEVLAGRAAPELTLF